MAATFERPFGIDQEVGDVLDVADFVRPLPYLQQRVVAGGTRVGRVEQQAVREFAPPAGGQLPVLALDIVNDGRSEEHTSELQSLMRISYAVFCLTKKKQKHTPLT